jgi:predicted ATPase
VSIWQWKELKVMASPPRVESLRVQNFRALRSVEFKELAPFTVLLGPNGSGKSTVFDVFGFLSDCFAVGLRKAWDKRGRARELKTRGGDGPLVIEIKYRERPGTPIITYHLAIDEERNSPVVVEEWLQWKRGSHGRPFRFLEYSRGEGRAISGEMPDSEDRRVDQKLSGPDLIAVNTLGQFAEHPRVAALRSFITDWYVSYLSTSDARGLPEAGPHERLSRTGDNLPNVIQYLKEQYPDELDSVFAHLRNRIPKLERVIAEPLADGRLLLQIKDAPFDQPILSKFASDGTLKMLAYLLILHDPNPPRFIGIEEPENFLHPRLLRGLAEECRMVSERTQLLATTHSPHFLDGMRSDEVWILYRDQSGHTQTRRACDVAGIEDFLREGASLGELWMEGRFGLGDPLVNEGAPTPRPSGHQSSRGTAIQSNGEGWER